MSKVEPVRKVITVAASQQRCFELFTQGIDRWWPRQHHIGSAPLKQTIIEPRIGGRWYATHEDGSESNTGRVLAYEPYDRVILAWQLDADWKYDPHFHTEVEVRFVAEEARRTRVELTHSKLEAYGVRSDDLRKQLDADNAWVLILDMFKKGLDS